MTSANNEVNLVIYDLSKGNRKSLTDRLLGIANLGMDIIPHTGIVVYGREYFYRRTVCNDDPAEFRKKTGLKPIQILSLGTTKVSRYKFEKWCAKVQTIKYSEDCYDLVSLNSNHFCQDAAIHGLKLSRGVPEWIFKVPLHFPLSFSFGQLLRPVLQSQHNSCLVQTCREEGLLEGEEIKNMGSFVAFIAGSTGIPISDNDSNEDDSSGSGSTISTTDGETATQKSAVKKKGNNDERVASRDSRTRSKASDNNNSDGRAPTNTKQSGKQNRDGPEPKPPSELDQSKNKHQKPDPVDNSPVQNDSIPKINDSKPSEATSEKSTNQETKPLKSNSSSSNRSGATHRSNTKTADANDVDQNDSIETKILTSQSNNLHEADEYYTEGRTCTPLLRGRDKIRRSKSTDKKEIRRRGSLSSIRQTLSNALNGQGKAPNSSVAGNNSSSKIDVVSETGNKSNTDSKKKDDQLEVSDSSNQQSISKAKPFSSPQKDEALFGQKEPDTASNTGIVQGDTTNISKKSETHGKDSSKLQKGDKKLEASTDTMNTVVKYKNIKSQQSDRKRTSSNETKGNHDVDNDKKKISSFPEKKLASDKKKNVPSDSNLSRPDNSEIILMPASTEQTNEVAKEMKSEQQSTSINGGSSNKEVRETNRRKNPIKPNTQTASEPNNIDTKLVPVFVKIDRNELDTLENKHNDQTVFVANNKDEALKKPKQDQGSQESTDPMVRAVESTDDVSNVKDIAAMNLLNPSPDRSYRRTKKQSNGDDNHPYMDSFYKPLVSSDTSSVATCVRRLSSILNKLHFDDDKRKDEKKRKYSLMVLQKVQSEIDTGKPLSARLTEGLCGFLLHCLENKKSTIHALLLLRVVTLQAPPSVTKPCFCWLTEALIQSWENDQHQQGEEREDGIGHVLQQPVARSLAWLVACNANTNFTTQADYRRLVYAATVDMNVSVPSIQLRQAACAFLYNTVLYRRNCCKVPTGSVDADELSPTFAIIGRACVDGLTDETDSTSRLRRIMILCRILRPRNRLTGKFWLHENARKLLLILGLEDRISAVHKQIKNCSDEESILCRNTIEEMIQKIRET